MKRLFFLFFIFLLGCETIPQKMPEGTLYTPYQESIVLEGRLLLNVTKALDEFDTQNHRTQSLHLKFLWVQEKETIDMTLFSPLGQSLAKVLIKPHQITLITSQKTLVAKSPEELFMHFFGFPLPVTHMRYWLQAYNQQQRHFEPFEEIKEEGWSLFYDKVEPLDQKTMFAKRLRFKRHMPAPSTISEIDGRVLIDEYSQLGSAK